MRVYAFNVKNSVCRCVFCGKDKDLSQMKSFQYGRKSMRKAGICETCFARFGVR